MLRWLAIDGDGSDGLILRGTSATGLAALYAIVLLTLYILVYYLD